jgi:ATP-binding cassette subfamily B (MDR/TAP) protein 1
MAGGARERDEGEDVKTTTDKGSSRNDAGAAATTKVPSSSLLGMFRYADRTDAALMVVGTVAAVANGMSEPVMTIVFAAVIECFGAGDDATVVHRVSKVRAYPSPSYSCC